MAKWRRIWKGERVHADYHRKVITLNRAFSPNQKSGLELGFSTGLTWPFLLLLMIAPWSDTVFQGGWLGPVRNGII